MKIFLPLLGLAALVTACNSSPEIRSSQAGAVVQQEAPVNNLDTIGLAQYQQWRAQNELMEMQEEQPAAVASAPVKRKVTPKAAVAKAPVKKASAPVRSTPAPASSSTGSGSSADAGDSNDSGTAAGSEDVAKEEKKGVSNATKGAVIGGVAGGAAGAVINKKNRVLGGVIGGVVGAAVGYGVGKAKDKKEGR